MNLKSLIIGELTAKLPIIQGGMGVGVSLSSLASAVAREGGIGVISAAQPGFNEEDFETNTKEANIRALKREIKKAKSMSNGGIIGVNIMVAMNNYEDFIKASVEAGADVIISGAGLPTTLPRFTKGSNTKIAPIVSSARAAKLMCKMWKERYNYLPDFLVVEGPKAGGHLGFKMDELLDHEEEPLDKIVPEVIEVAKSYKDEKEIPVIAAGGIYTGSDIAKFLKLGADGVQMATRFICTEECDADIKFKEEFLKCHEDEIKIIKSPVGMPGRAVHNQFLKDVEEGKVKVNRCFGCVKKCNPKTTPYCITRALVNAVKGDVDHGLIFTGTNGYRNDKIVKVHDLINELVTEAEAAI
ncbi:MAG: nitronate monooxygenase family protein [Inconstantimicrobium porci]|uniref:NAD(P)H-dependent flavin oxidoreductase n=1 Tax=Inconstantimicrobium porci TaxID=2652291 RepID=UPI002A90A6F8|nr:nitronate monooxygenase family protein [Inconstantimicrobium porci]MDY5910869.1 nitronate monooxygenase family protein [Inconstantimicrobium porci]